MSTFAGPVPRLEGIAELLTPYRSQGELPGMIAGVAKNFSSSTSGIRPLTVFRPSPAVLPFSMPARTAAGVW